jgi:hypothetical protein
VRRLLSAALITLLITAPVRAQGEDPVRPPDRPNLAAQALTLDDLPAGFAFNAARSYVLGEEPLDFHWAEYAQDRATATGRGQTPLVVAVGVAPALSVEEVIQVFVENLGQMPQLELSPFDGIPAVEGSSWRQFSGTLGGLPVVGYVVIFPFGSALGLVATLYLGRQISADQTAALARIVGPRLGAALEDDDAPEPQEGRALLRA